MLMLSFFAVSIPLLGAIIAPGIALQFKIYAATFLLALPVGYLLFRKTQKKQNEKKSAFIPKKDEPISFETSEFPELKSEFKKDSSQKSLLNQERSIQDSEPEQEPEKQEQEQEQVIEEKVLSPEEWMAQMGSYDPNQSWADIEDDDFYFGYKSFLLI